MDERPETKRPGLGERLRRLVDQRTEQRAATTAQTAIMNYRGQRHVVRLADLSASGAMILFDGDLVEGERVELQLLDQGSVAGQVQWVRDGRAGVSLADPAGPPTGE